MVTRCVLSACFALLVAAMPRAQDRDLETRLKAAVLSKLPQFVEWPREAMDGRPTVDVCVTSPNPFGDDLAALVSGETLNGKPMVVREVTAAADVAGCHVLFVGPGKDQQPHPLLRAPGSRPVLTVGDEPRFLDAGGMVALRILQGRVRFDVDAGAARRVGLRISSQLLRLAVSVRGEPS